MRHFEGYVKPMLRKIPVVRNSHKLQQAARRILNLVIDRKVAGLTAEYEQQRAAANPSPVPQGPSY
jgi:hypothetical protein